jgi:hypothetical protein
MARELSDRHKLCFRSVGEVSERFMSVLMRARTRGVEVGGKLLTREAVANAMILQFCAGSEAEQDAALLSGLSALEELLKGPDPAAAPVAGARRRKQVTT